MKSHESIFIPIIYYYCDNEPDEDTPTVILDDDTTLVVNNIKGHGVMDHMLIRKRIIQNTYFSLTWEKSRLLACHKDQSSKL